MAVAGVHTRSIATAAALLTISCSCSGQRRADAVSVDTAALLAAIMNISVFGPSTGIVWQAKEQRLFDRERSFEFRVENDAFAQSGSRGATADRAYTQGLRLTWAFSGAPDRWERIANALTQPKRVLGESYAPNGRVLPCTADFLDTAKRTWSCTEVRFGIGQTIFTPDNLVADTLQRSDRPYAASLFLQAGVVRNWARASAVAELTIGMIGPYAFGEQAQSLAHWTWADGRPRPMGWRYQLRSAPLLAVRSSWVKTQIPAHLHWLPETPTRYFQADHGPEVTLGTAQLYAAYAARARIGWNVDKENRTSVIEVKKVGLYGQPQPRLTRCDRIWWCSALRETTATYSLTWTGRGIAYNSLISGTPIFDAGRDGWRNVGDIHASSFVGERLQRFSLGFRRLTVFYDNIWRSQEVRELHLGHSIGSWNVSFSNAAK